MKKKLIVGLSIVLAGVVMNSWSAVVTNWVADPGFEGLVLNTDPSVGTAPWAAQEGNVWAVQREQGIVNSGSNSAVYQYYGNTDTIIQDLPEGLTVSNNAIYEVRFFLRHDELSTNPGQTNEVPLRVMVSTTTNGVFGDPVQWTRTVDDVLPSAPYIWEEQVMHFYESDFQNGDRVGEYMRLAIKNRDNNSKYRVFIDDVTFGLYAGPDAPPSSVLVGYYDSFNTNDYHAENIEGTLWMGKAYQMNANAGSSDGTYGSTNGASLAKTGYEVRIGSDPTNTPKDTVAFSVVNKTGSPLQLDSISFDFGRFFAEAPTNLTLLYSWGNLNGVASDTIIQTAVNTNVHGTFGDYDDYDWPLTNLSDRVLGAGETAAFKLMVSGTSNIWSSAAFDNIAVMGGDAGITAYEDWANDYGLVGGANDDDDGDGVDNLGEYGQNGDPTNSAVAGTFPVIGTPEEVSGTNWIGYVYLKRTTSNNGLTYSIRQNIDLVNGTWTNYGDIVHVGDSVSSGGFKYVTNAVPTDGKSKEFLQLLIEN